MDGRTPWKSGRVGAISPPPPHAQQSRGAFSQGLGRTRMTATAALGRSSPGVAISESVLPLVSAPSSAGPATEATQPAHVDPPADDRPRVALVGAHGHRPTDERLPLGCTFAVPPKVLYGHAARLRRLAA